jgi:DNA ligase (NAD+)
MTDTDYDEYLHEELNGENPLDDFLYGAPAYLHETPMLGIRKVRLEDAYDAIRAWGEHAPARYVTEPKVDGVAFSLRYHWYLGKYRLVAAGTRGNGSVGQWKHDHALEIRGIPPTIEGVPGKDFVVRGEVYSTVTTRAKVAGAINRDNPNMCKERGLRFIAWDCPPVAARRMPVVDFTWGVAVNKTPTEERLKTALSNAKRMEIPTDGIVVKVANWARRKRLGATSRSPRWAIAIKHSEGK